MPGARPNPGPNPSTGPKANAKPGPAIKTSPSNGKRGYAPERLAELPPKFFFDRPKFSDVGPTGAVLVGVRTSTHVHMGGPKISSLQPIFRSGTRLIEGERHGTVAGPETTTVAKSGYAVGGLRTHTGLGVDGFDVVFMRVKNGRLIPSDSYNSPWLGDIRGGGPTEVYSQGALPVGLHGQVTKSINALGLVILK